MHAFDEYSESNNNEEQLFKKFYDYADLEQNIIQKDMADGNGSQTGKWSDRFITSSIIQSMILLGLTISLVIGNMLFDNQFAGFLDLITGENSSLFIAGFLMYLALIVSFVITGILYGHLEVHSKKTIFEYKNQLIWIHFIGTNVSGTLAVLIMMIGGLSNTDFLSSIGLDYLQIVRTSFFFGLVYLICLLPGGYVCLTSYLKK